MQKTYGPKSVCQAVGISQRQLGYWGMIGVINPAKLIRGAKVFNRYTDEDVETLKKVKMLIEEGFFVSKAAEKIQKLKEEGLHPLTTEPAAERPAPLGENGNPSWQDPAHVLASSLYLEVRLSEELTHVNQKHSALTCMAIQILFPPLIKLSQQKNEILFKLAAKVAALKRSNEVISYKEDGIFFWLLPNRDIDQAHQLGQEVRKLVESFQWEVQNKKLNLLAAFGFSDHYRLPKKEGNLIVEAEKDLFRQGIPSKSVIR
ncbi:MAG: MerR family transcriptional regulator [Nitrospirae bacterium]|nr:MerR family transcriptional regulator [Candidatus Manganitrophaceae bacterium]